jgi:hypothetical protein
VIGRLVDVTADLDRVRVRADGRIVADHPGLGARGDSHRPGASRQQHICAGSVGMLSRRRWR